MQKKTLFATVLGLVLAIGLVTAAPLAADPSDPDVTLDPAEPAPEISSLSSAEVATAQAIVSGDPLVTSLAAGHTYTFEDSGRWQYAEMDTSPKANYAIVYSNIGAWVLIQFDGPISYGERSWPVVDHYYPPAQIGRNCGAEYCPPYTTTYATYPADQVNELVMGVDFTANSVVEVQPGPDAFISDGSTETQDPSLGGW